MTADPARRDRVAGADVVTCRELIAPHAAEALAGLLDIDRPAPGDQVAPLWHWIYLLERRRQRDLGPDGHAVSGIPAPPGPGRSRMFGGGRVVLHHPLEFGRWATRTTWLLRSVEKEGRSGAMTLATARSEIEQDGRPAIADEQDIIYRAGGSSLRSPAPARPEDGVEDEAVIGELEFDVDPIVLFRFSALTYNAHRIHYDLPYTAEEGYPGLVVHGPLQALLMGECLRRAGLDFVGQQFGYRLVAPTFGAQRLRVTAHREAAGFAARVRDGAGRVTATATLGAPEPPAAASRSDSPVKAD